MTVHKLTKDNQPALFADVWLWRDDSKRWVIQLFNHSIQRNVGNHLAYTHWSELTYPPRPE